MVYRLATVHLTLFPEGRFDVPKERVLSFTHERATVAAMARHHPDQPELADAGRRRLKVLKAERLIETLTHAEPVLTSGQRAHLALLLLPERGDGHA